MRFDTKMVLGVSVTAMLLTAGTSSVRAQTTQDTNAVILQRLEALERENRQLRSEIKRVEGKVATKPAAKAAPSAQVVKAAPVDAPATSASMVPTAGSAIIATSGAGYGQASKVNSDWTFEKTPGSGLNFRTPGGTIGIYGQFDVSIDDTTKGIAHKSNGGTDVPTGNVGWMPAISTNTSYVGVRGDQKIDDRLKFVYQLETQIDISVNSGIGESSSNQSNVAKGGLTSRNSFIGLANADWGAIKVGKTDTPYKSATAAMNPFAGMLGDYSAIMGNTGGDNRVEFGVPRMEHSLWWESPNWGGVKFAALFSPGQNRATDSSNIPSGSSDCAGGNSPLSGGNTNDATPAGACNDGAFSDAISLSATYQKDALTLVGAYERHFKVNRSSDIIGIYGPPSGYANPADQATVQTLFNADVADEDAFKFGLQYKFPTKTTVSAIFESMHRYVPAALAFQNERQRNGTWLAIDQVLDEKNTLDLGWAHAFRSPGDPGQHNTGGNVPTPDGLSTSGGADPQNQSDLLTAALKHKFSDSVLGYLNYATTINAKNAHYDLGAGGRGVTTDCHDASGASGGAFSNPHCWAGGRLQGVSMGLQYKF